MFDCTEHELKLLTDALKDNNAWIATGIRGRGLMRACMNKSLFQLMQKLFVLKKPKDLAFYTDGAIISKKLSDYSKYGGLDWDYTAIMSPDFWGTLYSLAFHIQNQASEHECFTYGERVPCTVYTVAKEDLKKAKYKFLSVKHSSKLVKPK